MGEYSDVSKDLFRSEVSFQAEGDTTRHKVFSGASLQEGINFAQRAQQQHVFLCRYLCECVWEIVQHALHIFSTEKRDGVFVGD